MRNIRPVDDLQVFEVVKHDVRLRRTSTNVDHVKTARGGNRALLGCNVPIVGNRPKRCLKMHFNEHAAESCDLSLPVLYTTAVLIMLQLRQITKTTGLDRCVNVCL